MARPPAPATLAPAECNCACHGGNNEPRTRCRRAREQLARLMFGVAVHRSSSMDAGMLLRSHLDRHRMGD